MIYYIRWYKKTENFTVEQMLKISSEENEDWSVVEKNHECQLSTARDILTDPSNINKQSFVHFTSAASEVKFNFADQLSAKALISNFWKKLKVFMDFNF